MNELRHYKTVRLLGKNSNFSMMREERLSNFELLRILAMFMIVAHHFVVHSGLNLTNELLSVNGIWMQLLMVGGKIGVNIFVLISGYFLIESSRLNYIKLIKFWLQVFFYSVFFFLITLLYQMLYIHTTVSISDIIHVLFPLSFEQWWFASVYFVLFLLSPFLNRLLKSINQKSFFGLLFMMFVIWSVIPSILLCDYLKNELIWFVFLYCLAAYIRLFGFSFERKKTLVLLICVYFTTVLLRVLCLYLEEEFTFPYSYSLVFYKDNMFPILLISLLVFLLFKNITIKHSKIINIVASATFGVYLIHENRYIRSVLKKYVFGRFGMDYRYLIPYSIFAIVVLFIICTCFELARMNLIEKKYMKWIRMNKDTISSIIKKLKDSIFHRVNRFHNSG